MPYCDDAHDIASGCGGWFCRRCGRWWDVDPRLVVPDNLDDATTLATTDVRPAGPPPGPSE